MLESLHDGVRGADPEGKKIDNLELRIEYPAIGLIPKGPRIRPKLRPPVYSRFRDKPDWAKFHLSLSNTNFIIRLPLKDVPPESVSPLGLPSLFAALMSITNFPGRSTLSIASYNCPERGDRYSFKLVTVTSDENRGLWIEGELTPTAWETAMSVSREQFWMPLVQDLLFRRSDRAYFHVNSRLSGYRWYRRQRAGEEWDLEPACDAKQLVLNNLRVVVGTRGEPDYVQTVRGHDFRDQREATFLLPCGYEQNLVVEQLRSMSVPDSIKFACSQCGERVMQEADREHLCLWRDQERRAKFCEDEEIWQELAQTFPLGLEPVSVETSSRPHRNFYGCSSTNASRGFYTKFCEVVAESDFTEMNSRAGIYFALKAVLDTVDDELAQSKRPQDGVINTLPSEWLRLIDLWLRRAAQLSSASGYDGRGIRRLFADEVVENEEVIEARKAVDELEESMLAASLDEVQNH